MTELGERTWAAIDSGPAPLVLVPVGACEQHGPHLPLDTDTRLAQHLARRAASALDAAVVAPAIGIGASGEHAGFPGTLSIGSDALTAVLVELVRSAGWARGVVLVNGHGGNLDAVGRAVATLHGEGRAVLSWWPRVPGGDAHAGHTETSLLLHLDEAVVDRAAIAPGATAPIGEIIDRLRRDGVGALSPGGVLGDPTTATPEAGRRIVTDLVADLVRSVNGWRTPP